MKKSKQLFFRDIGDHQRSLNSAYIQNFLAAMTNDKHKYDMGQIVD
jgi:hypothetical protein